MNSKQTLRAVEFLRKLPALLFATAVLTAMWGLGVVYGEHSERERVAEQKIRVTLPCGVST